MAKQVAFLGGINIGGHHIVHSVGSITQNSEIDVLLVYADYK